MTKKTDLQKIFFLDQHGCAKNQVDGELIIAELEKNGAIIGYKTMINWEKTDKVEALLAAVK